VGEVGGEAAVATDHPLERGHLVGRQVVLGPTAGAREVDVPGILGAVILGPALEMGVAYHPDLLEHGQGPVHRRGVHGGEPPLDPAGDVLGGDVAVGAEHLTEDGLALGRDSVAALPQHRDHGPAPVHDDAQATASQVRGIVSHGPAARDPPSRAGV
jgi:hypothetical protein